MSRHRRPSYSLARAYSTLINPRTLPLRNQKTTLLCIASNDNWTSERMATTRSFLSYSKLASTQDPQCIIRQQNAPSLAPSTLSRRSEFFDPFSIRYSSNNVNINNTNDVTATTTNDDDTSQMRGKECYKLATQALQNAFLSKQKHEARLLQEQYDAMDSQRKRTEQRESQKRQRKKQMDPRLQKLYNINETNNGKEGDATTTTTKRKDRAAGVAVVRTIVKQSQPKKNRVRVERTSHGNGQSNNNNNSLSADKAKQIDYDEHHWQQVAKKHMEEAAFRHGHCLALVRLGNEALERAKEKDDSSPLIDREGCRGWIDESPVDFATILDLSANIESDSDQQAENEDSQLPSPYLRLALHLYEEGGNRGSAEGWYNLGHLLWDMQDDATTSSSSGIIAHDSNYSTTKEKAMDAFHNAMKMGDADAMYFVASQYLSYEEGGGEEFDDDDALHLLLSNTFNRYGPEFLTSTSTKNSESPSTPERPAVSSITSNNNNQYQQHGYEILRLAALDHNHGPALHHLALLHLQNDNTEEFRHLLSKSAATGHPDSLFLRGHCHHSGTDGHAQDLRAAFDDFSAAADGDGHVDAMVSAGAMLHQGVVSDDGIVVVVRDQQRAFDLYQRAGELGSVEGWRNVVSCYATGEGVPKCLDTAKYIANTMLKE